jgi:chaperone required for assembly of F1-ATPase
MTGWVQKRFWRRAAAVASEGGHAIALDGRRARTPGKAALILPTRALADLVAAEWDAQGEVVDPRSMPATRMANAAIDRVTHRREEVAAALAAYGASDLLCYRADGPAALVARQAAAWDPQLAWAERALGARLAVTTGVMAVPQDPVVLARLSAQVLAFDPFRLSAFHELVVLSGSLVLAFAVVHGALDPATAWNLSRIDEDWQAEQWGRDAEAEAAAAFRRAEFLGAARFFRLCEAAEPG